MPRSRYLDAAIIVRMWIVTTTASADLRRVLIMQDPRLAVLWLEGWAIAILKALADPQPLNIALLSWAFALECRSKVGQIYCEYREVRKARLAHTADTTDQIE